MSGKTQKQNKKNIRVLGIETSCDETSASIVENGRTIISNVVASQIDLHAVYGGVFPEVASRQHVVMIDHVIREALAKAYMSVNDLDLIAVTRGPGLAGSLLVGLNAAKGISLGGNIPFVGVNHLEGHIYSDWLIPPDEIEERPEPQFPLLALLVSGGHSELNLMTDHLAYQRLGGTLDDAAGEAFDKVARLIGLSYPGGPSIQKAAQMGRGDAFAFPRAWLEGTWNFSFSGLKTAVLRVVQSLQGKGSQIPVNDLAASFQAAVVDVLVNKTIQAARAFKPKEIVVAGGVSANQALRDAFLYQKEFPVHIPPLAFCTDNAAMIAAAGTFRFFSNRLDTLDVDVLPVWPLS